MTSVRIPLLALTLAAAQAADARVISYAPVSDRVVLPAVQDRTNRHYALVEVEGGFGGDVIGPPPFFPCPTFGRGRLVIFDSRGAQEPRVVLPRDGETAAIAQSAVWEEGEDLRLLAETDADTGDNPTRQRRLLYSPDGGASWKPVALPINTFVRSFAFQGTDVGGPLARGRGAQLRPATRDVPFVFTTQDASGKSALYAVTSGGGLRLLLQGETTSLTLVGTDLEGSRLLVSGAPILGGTRAEAGLYLVDLEGHATRILATPFGVPSAEGWITPDGGAYLDVEVATPAPPFTTAHAIYLLRGSGLVEVARPLAGAPPYGATLFAVPTADFTGAWIVQRGPGLPTVLSRHGAGGLARQWSDATGPELEAVHAAASGETLLLQVHRPRQQADQRLFQDPALAIWRSGQPAPRSYDELFLVEQPSKGFVSLDVDAVAAGAPFVFDGGFASFACFTDAVPPAPGAGGSDVVQEWGAVRASLRQKLVIAAVARAGGAFGSHWQTELILQNPSDEPVVVGVDFLPSGAEARPAVIALVELAPREIRIVPDVLKTLFHLETASGALELTPQCRQACENEPSIAATSRTFTTTDRGTFGMGVGAVDRFASASPRFPLSFAGALQGTSYRTNLATVDVSGRGVTGSLFLMSALEAPLEMPFGAPPAGQAQLNGLGAHFGTPSGALLLTPHTGEAVPALVVIDNRTNDPTFFPPDLPAPYVRTIPALVHADGANGARYRSDLFLFNPGTRIASVTLAAKPWTSPQAETMVTLTLLPHEAKAVRDALPAIFQLSGVARLRYVSGSSFGAPSAGGIRVTSRTYTVTEGGGTFGLLMPPLNSFQSAGSGESLEILGARGGAGFRTNLSLVELTAFADGASPRVLVEILDARGATLDSFETTVPTAGGRQIDDLFRVRGLREDAGATLIRVTPLGGMVGAYATLIDQGTNDPIYLPAALGSR